MMKVRAGPKFQKGDSIILTRTNRQLPWFEAGERAVVQEYRHADVEAQCCYLLRFKHTEDSKRDHVYDRGDGFLEPAYYIACYVEEACDLLDYDLLGDPVDFLIHHVVG